MRRIGGFLILAAALAFLPGISSLAGDTYVMKLSTQLNETTPMVRGFKQLAENVKAASKGKLLIEVYPSAQLGSDEDVIEQAMQGVNVAVLTDGGRMGNYVRDFGIIGMAYFADNYDDVIKVVESATYKKWEDDLSAEGIRVLSFNWYDGPRHFLTHEPIKTPADLSGQRIRTPGAPAWAESIRALGATPVAMPWGEVYSAVQSRAIDGCEVQDTSTLGSRTYEVLKYRNKTGHFQLINGLIVGERWFKTLPADLQKILLDETKAEGQRNARLVEREIVEIEKKLTEYGMISTQPEVAAFKKAAEAAYEKLNFTALRTQVYKEIGK
ncbi:MAG: C4-dicarboxylate TRAP transporter substrate-binding protein [Planctomycetota bacterium]|nr:C4-dicarboxylate TRAP transporter substrate-binding protein [Planctomycetota bacterium]